MGNAAGVVPFGSIKKKKPFNREGRARTMACQGDSSASNSWEERRTKRRTVKRKKV